MRYITAKRFKRKGIGGDFNLPYGTELEKRDDGVLYYNDKPVCVARSAASHVHFVSDDDGNGLKRYYWTSNIIKRLDGNVRAPSIADVNREAEEAANKRWEIIISDTIAKKYRRPDHVDYWLWDDTFYNAPLEDLRHIGTIIGVEEREE